MRTPRGSARLTGALSAPLRKRRRQFCEAYRILCRNTQVVDFPLAAVGVLAQ